MAPKPPTLGSAAAKPWRSSGSRKRPRNAPSPPTFGSAAAKAWRSSGSRKRPRNGPQTPNARKRRGKAVALLGHMARALYTSRMLSVEQAQAEILGRARVLPTERVDILAALGR